MLEARAVEHNPFLILDWRHGQFSAAWMAYKPLLRWKDEIFQAPLPPYPLVPFSSQDQLARSWKVEVAEEREEEIQVGEEEAWVEKASQLLPSLAGFLVALEDYVGVSFEYPYLQACLVVMRVN